MAKLVDVEHIGAHPVYDITVDEHHNFIANGVVVHNCMLISKVLSGFTGPEANKLRKAIGKKLEELMAEMKVKFINGANPRVEAGEITEDEVLEVWGTLESFAGYGFNKCVDGSTRLASPSGSISVDGVAIMLDEGREVTLYSVSDDGIIEDKCVEVIDCGEIDAYEVCLDEGSTLICSLDHKFMCVDGVMHSVKEIMEDGLEMMSIDASVAIKRKFDHAKNIMNGTVVTKILLTKSVGKRRLFNLEMSSEPHNYVLANGLVSKNSHAVAYSAITTVQLWLKYNYPVEYITALANNTKQGKKKASIGVGNLLVHYLNYGRKRGFEVLSPCVNNSEIEFTIENDQIRFSLDHIKNVASAAAKIVELAPYESISDFYDRCVYQQSIKSGANAGKMRTTRPNKKVVDSLIASGAFDDFAEEGTTVAEKRNSLIKEYYRVKKEKKEESPVFTAKQWKTKEVEVLGLCLSEPPLLKTWASTVAKKGWTTIDEAEDKKKVLMFGQIMACRAHTSKNGNSMLIVTLSDGIDSIDFFVFEGGRQLFFDTYKTGNIVAIPLKKFDDGNTRFFDDYGDGVVVAT